MRHVLIFAVLMVSFAAYAATPIQGGYQEVAPPANAGRSFNIFIEQQQNPQGEPTVFLFGALNTYESNGQPVTYYFGGALARTFDREFVDTGVFATASADLFRPENGTVFGGQFQSGNTTTIGSIDLTWSDNRNVTADIEVGEVIDSLEFAAAEMNPPLNQLLHGQWNIYMNNSWSEPSPSNPDSQSAVGFAEFQVDDPWPFANSIPIIEPDQPFYSPTDATGMVQLGVWRGSDGFFYAKRLVRDFRGTVHHFPAFRLLITPNLIVGYGINTLDDDGLTVVGPDGMTDYSNSVLENNVLVMRRDSLGWSCIPESTGDSCRFRQEGTELP